MKQEVYICEECFEELEEKDAFWCMAKNKSHQYILCENCVKIIKPKEYKPVKEKLKRKKQKKMILTDESLMPYGKHEGTKMANVPTKYLMWMYDNNKCSTPVKNYVKENLDVLEQENKIE